MKKWFQLLGLLLLASVVGVAVGRGIRFLAPAVGATLPVAGQTYTLAGSGTTGSATSITLSSLTIPQTGYELQDSDFSDTFYITFEPGNRQRQEIASCTTVTQNANNTATLSGCTRGLLPFTPFTASSSYQFAHGGGTSVIFSDPPQLFNQFTAKDNGEVITGQWRYDSYPTVTSGLSMATTTYQLVTKQYADSIANQGAATSTESVAGIAELATQAEMAASTDYGALRPLVLQAKYATSTITTTGSYLVVTKSDGRIDASFGGAAYSIANLDENAKVYQNPQSAQVTSTFSKIPLTSGTTSTLHGSWFGTTTPGAVFYVGSDGYAKGLAIGSYGQVLTVSTTTGFPEWKGVASRLVFVTTTIIDNTDTETTIVTTTIPAGAMGANGYVKFKLFISNFQNTDSTITLRLKIGATTVATALLGAAAVNEATGEINGVLSNVGSQSSQVGIVSINFGTIGTSPVYSTRVARGTSAVNMAVAQDMAITMDFSNDTNVSSTIAGGYLELVSQ